MGLGSVAGVFIRYFIVGFFLPAFFALIALTQMVSYEFLPDAFHEATTGGQAAIVGGAALLVGLVLLGLHGAVVQLYEGAPLRLAPLAPIGRLLVRWQRRRFDRVQHVIDDESQSESDRFDATFALDRYFPRDREGLAPTSFGNMRLAAERHSFQRWHLNHVAVWPHVENLLSPQEAEVLADARSDLAFFLNGSLLSTLTGIAVIVDALVHDPAPAWYLDALTCAAPFALAALAYYAAWSVALLRWGDVIRADIDLHRLEVYEKLGLRRPLDFSDERLIAWHLNATLLTGEHLPDDIASGAAADAPATGSNERND
jgi:hypothetical protein